MDSTPWAVATMNNKYFWILFSIVGFYIFIGAAIFRALEADKEIEMKDFLEGKMNKFIGELWNVFGVFY